MKRPAPIRGEQFRRFGERLSHHRARTQIIPTGEMRSCDDLDDFNSSDLAELSSLSEFPCAASACLSLGISYFEFASTIGSGQCTALTSR